MGLLFCFSKREDDLITINSKPQMEKKISLSDFIFIKFLG